MKKIIISCLVFIVVIVVGYNMYAQHKTNQFKEEGRLTQLAYKAQYFANATQVIDKLEQNGIYVDEDYKNEIKSIAKDITKGFDVNEYGIYILSEIFYLDDRYDCGHRKDIEKLLEKYYYPDEKLFGDDNLDYYDGGFSDTYVSDNISIMRELQNTKLFDKYNICEGLANWYNKNADKKDLDEDEKDDLIYIIYILKNENKLELIDERIILDQIKDDMCEGNQEIIDEPNASNISTMKYVNLYYQMYFNDYSYDGVTDRMLSKINTAEELDYIEEDSMFVVFLKLMLDGVDKIDKDSFFGKNINKYLVENYTRLKEQWGI